MSVIVHLDSDIAEEMVKRLERAAKVSHAEHHTDAHLPACWDKCSAEPCQSIGDVALVLREAVEEAELEVVMAEMEADEAKREVAS